MASTMESKMGQYILDDNEEKVPCRPKIIETTEFLCPNDGSLLYEEEGLVACGIGEIATLFLSCQKCKFSTTMAPRWSVGFVVKED